MRIREQDTESLYCVNITTMVYDLIEIIRIIVMSHMSDQIVSPGFMEIGHQF